MDAFVLHGPRDIRLEQREERSPNDHEVVIDIRRTGICGSDVHYYNDFQIGQFVPQKPLVLGHEFSGVVVKRGSAVTAVDIGDSVTVEPSIECGSCKYCRMGRYNLCTNLRFIGTAATIPHIDGGFAERVVVPETHCYTLNDGLDFGAGALVEPLAVGAQAVSRVGAVSGAKILVTGGGTIGQMVLAVAKANGATDITLADPEEYPRSFAADHGAKQTIDPTVPGISEKLFADGGYDIVFEASGSPAALAFAYEVVGRGGTIVQIGTQPKSVTLPANLAMSKELMILGSFRYAHVYPQVLDIMRAGLVNVEDMISVVYPFAETKGAMERAVAKDRVVKVQIERT